MPDTERECDSGTLVEKLEKGSFWASEVPDREIRRTAENVLGKSPAWSTEVDIWGDESSTCLKMIQEDGRVVEIIFRVDLRNVQEADLVRLLDGFRQAHVILIDEGGRRCEPTLPSVRDALAASAAWSYVQDPGAFIASLPVSGD